MSTVTNSVAGAEVLVLAAVGERVDLAVAVHRAVGPGEHEACCTGADRRPARPVAISGTSRRPTRRARAACSARNCDDGPPSGSAMPGVSIEKPVENVSVSRTSPAPRSRRPRRSSGRGGRSWRRGPPTRCRAGSRRPATRSSRTPSPVARRPRRAPRAACRTRSAPGGGRSVTCRRTPRSGSRRRRTARAAPGRTPCRRRRAAPGGCRR